MTDITQGADNTPNDEQLFQEAVGGTLEEFENPKGTTPDTPAAPDKPVDSKPAVDRPTPDKVDDAPANIPPQRLREEAEARRRAERERDEIAARLRALQQPPQPEKPKPDLFANPEEYVLSLVKPLLEQQAQERQLEREQYSMDTAAQRFGPEMVVQSRQALEHFMQRGDPGAWDTYNRAMKSHDPYGVIAGWFHERSTLHQIGGDLNAYQKRVREEALKDPEYLRSALEYARKNATTNGNFANQPPVRPSVPNLPSLGNIGAGGGDGGSPATEPSDMELFRAATTAKRR